MIRLSNGHCLEFIVASGALGFDGRGYIHEWPLRWLGLIDPKLFTVFTKTLLPNRNRGNFRCYAPWRVVKFINSEGDPINPLAAMLGLV